MRISSRTSHTWTQIVVFLLPEVVLKLQQASGSPARLVGAGGRGHPRVSASGGVAESENLHP